jgi:hypothetical protein
MLLIHYRGQGYAFPVHTNAGGSSFQSALTLLLIPGAYRARFLCYCRQQDLGMWRHAPEERAWY